MEPRRRNPLRRYPTAVCISVLHSGLTQSKTRALNSPDHVAAPVRIIGQLIPWQRMVARSHSEKPAEGQSRVGDLPGALVQHNIRDGAQFAAVSIVNGSTFDFIRRDEFVRSSRYLPLASPIDGLAAKHPVALKVSTYRATDTRSSRRMSERASHHRSPERAAGARLCYPVEPRHVAVCSAGPALEMASLQA